MTVSRKVTDYKKLRLLFTSVLMLLNACTQVPDTPIRVGTNLWIGYEPLYLARALELFDSERVRLVEYVSSSQTMRDLRDGSIDAAALTLDEAIFLAHKGVDLRVVMVMDFSVGADALIVKPNIKNAIDLRGKSVGVETSAVGAYMMFRFLEESGLKSSDINIVNLDSSQHLAAFEIHKVDALMTFDPMLSQLVKEGAKILFDSKQIPNEIIDVLVVRTDALEVHKAKLSDVLGAWYKATEYLSKNKENAVRLMRARTKTDTESAENIFASITFPSRAENKAMLIENSVQFVQRIKQLESVMKENHLLRSSRETSMFIDQELLSTYYP